MPKVYRSVNVKTKEPFATFFQVFTGPDTPFNKNLAPRIPHSFPDGTSNTFLIAEGGEAVPWAKPADVTYRAGKPLPKLGGNFEDGFYCVFADGSVHFISRKVNEKTLRALITPAGGEVIDYNQINGR